jgi:hypothetical protein
MYPEVEDTLTLAFPSFTLATDSPFTIFLPAMAFSALPAPDALAFGCSCFGCSCFGGSCFWLFLLLAVLALAVLAFGCSCFWLFLLLGGAALQRCDLCGFF